jgi:hypothetical protein
MISLISTIYGVIVISDNWPTEPLAMPALSLQTVQGRDDVRPEPNSLRSFLQKLDNWYEHEVNVDHHDEDEQHGHDGHEGHEDEHEEGDHWTGHGQELGREKEKHHERAAPAAAAASHEKSSVRVDQKHQPRHDPIESVTRGDITIETVDDFDGLTAGEIIPPEKKTVKVSTPKKTSNTHLQDHEVDHELDYDFMDELEVP